MSEVINPLPYDQILHALADNFRVRTLPIQVEPEWFDPSQSDENEESSGSNAGYPFNLGLWAEKFERQIREMFVLLNKSDNERRPIGPRLDLVFCYTFGEKHFRGIIRYDWPAPIEISVRVTEQRHLKITRDSVILASVADGTEFREWRRWPMQDDFAWIPFKQLTSQRVRQRFWYEVCPSSMHDLRMHLNRVFSSTIDEVGEKLIANAPTKDPYDPKGLPAIKEELDQLRKETITVQVSVRCWQALNELQNAGVWEITHTFALDYSRAMKDLSVFLTAFLPSMHVLRVKVREVSKTVLQSFETMVGQKHAEYLNSIAE